MKPKLNFVLISATVIGIGASALIGMSIANADQSEAAAIAAAQRDERELVESTAAEARAAIHAVGCPLTVDSQRAYGTVITDRPADAWAAAQTQVTSDEQIAAQQRFVDQHLATTFKSAAASVRNRITRALASSLAAEADPNQRIIGAGIDSYAVDRVEISDSSALVVATFHRWDLSLLRSADGNWDLLAPEGTSEAQISLSRDDAGSWYVADLVVVVNP